MVGAAATLLLSKRENREKLRRTFEEWAREEKGMLRSVADRVDEFAHTSEDEFENQLKEIKSTVEELSEELEKKRRKRRFRE